ncbi:MAG: hypothetical protein JO101_07445 [Candidatus Eremiobacteraeota bacterium]|nr:hypothetical protein [Candidatus Eremiobacteraeota bacterium]MBV8355137.1 hypothetical protein [Candidatus Eremiobacteraeota bacterium]
MSNENKPKFPTPGEASRAGLADSNEAGEQHDAPEAAPLEHAHGPAPTRTPDEKHRGGPLPNQKK